MTGKAPKEKPAKIKPKPVVKARQLDPEAVLSLKKGKWIHFGKRPFDCPSRYSKMINEMVSEGLKQRGPPERCRNCFRVILVKSWNGGKNAKRLAEAINYYINLSQKGELKLPVGGDLGRPAEKVKTVGKAAEVPKSISRRRAEAPAADELVAVFYFESEKQRDEFRSILEGDHEGIEGLEDRGVKAEIKRGRACMRIRTVYPEFFEEAAKERGRMRREVGKEHLATMADKFSGYQAEGVPKEPAAEIRMKPAIQRKVEFAKRPPEARGPDRMEERRIEEILRLERQRFDKARRLGRRGKEIGVRVPPPTPRARRPKRKEVPSAEREPWIRFRRGLEGFFAFFGTFLLIYGFVGAYGLMGSSPDLAALVGLAVAVALGVTITIGVLLGADSRVKAVGGNVFTATGLSLLIYCILTTYGLIGATPLIENALWLGIMMAIGVFITLTGIPLICGQGYDERKVWGNVFTVAGFGALGAFVFAVHGLVGKALQLGNLVWPFIMVAISGFLILKGSPLALEHKDRTRMAWVAVILGTAASIGLYCVFRARDMGSRILETVNGIWLATLIVIFSLLLLWGIKLVRER